MSHITVFNNEKAFLRKLLIFIVFSAIILLSFASCEKQVVSSGKSESNIENETENSADITDTNNHETDNIKVKESEILDFFDMTFGEIKNAGYELNYLYSYQGPGAPVYELGSEIGVFLMFSADESNEYKVQNDTKPYRVIIRNPNIELFGLKIGMSHEEENKVISEWDESGADFLHVGVYYTEKYIDDYSVTAFREVNIEDLKMFCLENNIAFSEKDYERDFVQYEIIPKFAEKERINPHSEILSFEIKKNK